MQKETAFKIKVIKYLKTLPNTWFLKTQEVARSGTPDILAVINGFFVALELKTDEGRVSKLQEYNLNKIIEAKGISLVVQPSNLAASIVVLNSLSCNQKTKRGNRHDKTKLQNT